MISPTRVEHEMNKINAKSLVSINTKTKVPKQSQYIELKYLYQLEGDIKPYNEKK